MVKHIIFVGNCQIAALCELYRLFAEDTLTSVINYIPSYQHLTAENKNRLVNADIIVEQVLDMSPAIDLEGVSPTAKRYFVPLVAAGFLWPFAGSAHPKNIATTAIPSGPYGPEMGDSYLNRLILSEHPQEEALVQYICLDVPKLVDLDRRFEIWIDRQSSRDEISGYAIANEILSHYKTEPLFRTPHHPNLRIGRWRLRCSSEWAWLRATRIVCLARSPLLHFPMTGCPFTPPLVDISD